jgi:hypothetical protein
VPWVTPQGMGFHQLSARLLVWLILNQLQLWTVTLILAHMRPSNAEPDLKQRRKDKKQWKTVAHTL